MNIIKFLRELPEWNELIKLPAKVKELEKRIKELENPSIGEKFPSCKGNSFTIVLSSPLSGRMGKLGVIKRVYRCEDCGFEEPRTLTPKNEI